MARGELHRLYPGVFAMGHTALSREGRWLAAVFAAGEGSALCRKSCAGLLEIERWPPRVPQVLVPRRHRPVVGIELHETRNLDPRDVTVVNGIPCTTVPRLFVDLSDELIPEELTHYIHEAAHRGVLDLKAVQRTMARVNGRHNLDVLETAIEDWLDGSAGTRSRGEIAFRRAVTRGRAAAPGYEPQAARHRGGLPLAGTQARDRDRRPTAQAAAVTADRRRARPGPHRRRLSRRAVRDDRGGGGRYSTCRFGASPQSCSRR